jgi:hypothetical protein
MSIKKVGKTRGPEPERLKLEGDWKALIGEALQKKKPPEGWPESPSMPQRSPKTKAKKK